ncbi:uncharacterized protein [Solanum tuberosum]|uniref:uncharacterized protein n=1 Tax=Solanum tuberosum TaxID=4113 RepID=UPI00073A478A|nr:PREDICTED: uncharacterized protein LOC102603278 [Solanum tuberosum]
MSPSVARGLLNLQTLNIRDCQSMEEAITEEEEQGEGIMILFSRLKYLSLAHLPKLGHFFLTNHALEFPFLRYVEIEDCPEMKTFVQQGISVSTPILICRDEVKVMISINGYSRSSITRNKKLVMTTKLNLVMPEVN